MMTVPRTIISLRDVSFAYGDTLVLEDINLDIREYDFLGIIGPNGSGKTTLLKLILGLLKPDSGTIRIRGQLPVRARGHIGYVPQFANFDPDFPAKVLEAVMLGLLRESPPFGPFRKQQRVKARNALAKVNATELEDRRVGELSGGELQRVLVARALAGEPEVLLLDEPTASIDYKAEENFFDLLRRLNTEVTIAMVSHDIGFIASQVNRVACLNRRLVCHPTEEISSEILASVYETPVDLIAHQHRMHNNSHQHGESNHD